MYVIPVRRASFRRRAGWEAKLVDGKPLYINHNAQVIRTQSLLLRNHFPTGDSFLGLESRPSLLEMKRVDTSPIEARKTRRQVSLASLKIATVVGAPGIRNGARMGPTPRRVFLAAIMLLPLSIEVVATALLDVRLQRRDKGKIDAVRQFVFLVVGTAFGDGSSIPLRVER